MELITIKSAKEQKENSLFSIELDFYSDLYNDLGQGFIIETCLYKKEKTIGRLASFTVGCYFIKIKAKKEFIIDIIYEKGKLYLSEAKDENLIADLCAKSIKEKIETEEAEIQIEFY
jgi:uncharacterized membrane protein (Fun14 family)